MTRLELKKLLREEIKKTIQTEGFLDFLKKKKKEAPKPPAGKKIIGMDFDGYYIDEDGNRVN